ncbi:Aspartic protease [Mycena chlorophos]|uniref:Aspartic protease n=1 Tax=Mycena chlorophos TaxID=658473 RepID=A0A8H6WQU7_MYCCL|nr:Aspartic protease [Mycena chlorophos]
MARFSFVVLAAIVSLVVASPAAFEPRATPVPFATVPVKKTNSGKTKSIKALLARDLRRFNVDASDAVGTAPATNEDDTYVASVKVGTQTFDLIVDTGSSNTWVGSGTKYNPGSTATDTRDSFSVEYGSGSASGTEYTDNVGIGGLTISKQSIGDASKTSEFQGVDGIVGFGPVDLTEDTVSGQNTVPTVMQNLLSQGLISTNVLGVSFAPESGSDDDDTNGELALGGVDSSKYSGTLSYVSTTSASPYSEYWGITVSSTTYNGKSIGSSASAIVDTGTTLIYIPTATYNTFSSDTGGKTDSSSGLLSWSSLPTGNFGFTIGGVSYTLTPAQYTIPQAQYSVWGLSSGKYYSWISAGGTSAADVNFIIGQKFLENYYSVFDTSNSRVGFATRGSGGSTTTSTTSTTSTTTTTTSKTKTKTTTTTTSSTTSTSPPTGTGLPSTGYLESSSGGGLLTLGTWSTQTLATMHFSGSASSFTFVSSKGDCGIDDTGLFACGPDVTSTTFSAVSSGSDLLLVGAGSISFSSDGVPSGETVYPVYANADHANVYTINIVSNTAS